MAAVHPHCHTHDHCRQRHRRPRPGRCQCRYHCIFRRRAHCGARSEWFRARNAERRRSPETVAACRRECRGAVGRAQSCGSGHSSPAASGMQGPRRIRALPCRRRTRPTFRTSPRTPGSIALRERAPLPLPMSMSMPMKIARVFSLFAAPQ